jgi:peptide-methionine (S)-S-oxide reductase
LRLGLGWLLSGTVKLLSLLTLAACAATVLAAETKPMKDQPASDKPAAAGQRITFGGGCFWCTEAVFQRLKGVKTVVSGYAGGTVQNPTYKQITTGDTGHAEVVQLEFDPAEVSFETLLKVFWAAHDPTTLNRQGADQGTQYRSVIFYENDEQKAAAEKSKAAAQPEFKDPIVTEIAPLAKFYKAEDYHQNYFNLNADRNPYCTVVIRPKLQKLLQKGLIKD